MNTNLILRVVLWSALALLGSFVLLNAFIAVRYSPGYVYRELFMDLGTPYDYRVLPGRELTAGPEPFQFAPGASQETRVQAAFRSGSQIQDLDAYLAGAGTQAFLVIQDDTIIYERYFKGLRRDSLVTSYSVAKSFASALVGIAIQEGYIHSEADPITDYLPELAERDPRFKDIQVRHLLQMASGLRYDDDRLLLPEDDNLTYGFDDLRHLALAETQVVAPPGQTFVYNNYNPLLLGLILERATGRPVTAYLQEKIWTPLGMEFDGSWSLDAEKNGFEKMESGINARAIDFAKLGRLYLNGGRWNGVQVVPADWVAASTRDSRLIQGAPIYYGYMWWGERCNPDSQDFYAFGDRGQIVYVSPGSRLVIVRHGDGASLEGENLAWAGLLCHFARALPFVPRASTPF